MEIEAGGVRWPIVFTYRVLLDVGKLTGLDPMTLHLGHLNAAMLRGTLFSVLREAGCPLSIEDAGALLDPAALTATETALYRAWAASFPDPEPLKPNGQPEITISTVEAWARARFDLGLSDEEWLAMTPRMLYALTERQIEDMRHREMMIAILCAVTVNSGFGGPKTSVKPDVFMQHPWPPEPEPPRRLVYGEEVLAAFH